MEPDKLRATNATAAQTVETCHFYGGISCSGLGFGFRVGIKGAGM